MVSSHCTSPYGPPAIGTLCVPERIECRPVITHERLGVHCGSTLKLSNLVPSRASLSMFGVGAPRSTPPP